MRRCCSGLMCFVRGTNVGVGVIGGSVLGCDGLTFIFQPRMMIFFVDFFHALLFLVWENSKLDFIGFVAPAYPCLASPYF